MVAGAVIIRQRPMTANNVVFMTLEDETGHSNFIVMPDTFERFRPVINQNDFLVIKAVLEERGMLKALYFQADQCDRCKDRFTQLFDSRHESFRYFVPI